jgi:hypothetical protein
VTFPTKSHDAECPLVGEPKPAATLRVFMVYRAVAAGTTPKPRVLETPERVGFTLVEWGSAKLSSRLNATRVNAASLSLQRRVLLESSVGILRIAAVVRRPILTAARGFRHFPILSLWPSGFRGGRTRYFAQSTCPHRARSHVPPSSTGAAAVIAASSWRRKCTAGICGPSGTVPGANDPWGDLAYGRWVTRGNSRKEPRRAGKRSKGPTTRASPCS